MMFIYMLVSVLDYTIYAKLGCGIVLGCVLLFQQPTSPYSKTTHELFMLVSFKCK
jgi:hypothetical protein